MARSGAPLVLVLALLLLVTAPHVTPAITCGQVTSALSSCISYATGKGSLTSACCSGVKSLNSAAKTSADRKTACTCIKSTGELRFSWTVVYVVSLWYTYMCRIKVEYCDGHSSSPLYPSVLVSLRR
ncbi:hypothetical protein C4D60_Mb04t17880 [Musa balbisiana]|uniref:Non-specific lipid-transfer protein n=1 Tax=Musa balbisiana TaxID=52838 RepID=A0A4S8KCU0_MUSBA|nr:hypothetical protein C4D60_Mb04t17880 [Musa balbisiana]